MKGRFSFFLILCVAFLDYMGVGLVFPLFAGLLFDPAISILPSETSASIRGLWMGLLIALTPLIQFFFSPILGSLSDQKGRKNMILFGLAIGLLSYLVGILGVKCQSLGLLILYRILFGFSASTMTVIQAAIVDISTNENKAHRFGIYNMALGTGFTFGPFLGGELSDPTVFSWFDYSTPFLLGAVLTGMNLILLYWKFHETRKLSGLQSFDFFRGIRQTKQAFQHPTLRFSFLAFFLFVFGWDFFMEFVSVTLKFLYDFSTAQIGYFYAYTGFFYALSVGVLIRPFVTRVASGRILFFSMILGGIFLLLFLFIENPFFLWIHLAVLNFLLALFFPVASTYVSNHATKDNQGEILGIYHSVQALALTLSPMFSGSLVGAIPAMPIYLGGFLMCVGGVIFSINYAFSRKVLHRIDKGA